MFATIYLPDFYLQSVLRHQPHLRPKPVALIDDLEKKAVIIQLNAAAEQAGVRCG
ncbi:MAG: impB/mucB/samB family, partial [Verrucomicrobiota bacterium]